MASRGKAERIRLKIVGISLPASLNFLLQTAYLTSFSPRWAPGTQGKAFVRESGSGIVVTTTLKIARKARSSPGYRLSGHQRSQYSPHL